MRGLSPYEKLLAHIENRVYIKLRPLNYKCSLGERKQFIERK